MKERVMRTIKRMEGKQTAYIYHQDNNTPEHIAGLIERVADQGIKLRGCYSIAWCNIETFIAGSKTFVKQDFR